MIRFIRAKLKLLEALDETLKGIAKLPKGPYWEL